VVGGDDEGAPQRLDDGQETGELEIDGLDGEDGGLVVAGVAHHVAVRVVDARVR